MLVVANHLVPLQSFQEKLFHDLDGHRGEIDLHADLCISLISFLKYQGNFSLFPVSWNLSGMSNMMDSGLTTSMASSLRTSVWVLSGPMDLCTFRLLKWSQTWFFK